ncbi:MAG: right-handed parallel beta-helix repeat-containing protein [Armatimonadota bacterium]
MNSAEAGLLMITMLIGLALTAAPAAIGAEYYLSPDGDDNAAGDRENPWQSIAKANETLQPGDTAIFLEGEYAGTIAPDNSGTAGAPVTYRSIQPRAARLVAEDVPMLMRFNGHEHVIVEGFEVDGLRTGGWFDIDDSRYLTIRGCNMRRARPTHSIRNSAQIKLLDNVFSKDTVTSDTLRPLNCSQMLIEGNSFTRVGHCPLVLQEMVDSVVRGNVFRAEWGRNYSFWASGRLLIEGNIITRARDSAWSADPVAKNLYDESIFRFNRVFDNLGMPLSTSSYIWRGVSPTGLYRYPFRAMNSRFYHNTFTDNLGPAWRLNGMNVSAHIFQNNIFYRNDPYGGSVQVARNEGISGDNQFITNLFRGTGPGQTVVHYRGSFWTAEEANQNTATFGDFWSEFHRNIDADPAFVDPDNRDYRLSADSEAIDAGTPLALALGEGTGTALPVTDGVPFYDGFGIEGEEGDFIAIGEGSNIAQIERVELRYYQPAILHLDREVTWEDGMPVSLPWAGDAPDIGAFQHGVEHPTAMIALAKPAVAEPGQPIQFSLDTPGKEIDSVTWDFEDGSFSHEEAPTHSYAETGHYGVVARAVFTNGRRSVAALFVNIPERIDPVLPLVDVDFEDETYMSEWGWYMKFYRGHQTGQERVVRPGGDGKCMHLFYSGDRANNTSAQIAPGAWKIDEYPFVRFAYRIPEGVPVGIEINTFGGPDQPGGFILGGTAERADTRNEDLGVYTLVYDGQWHEITIDVRKARQAHPGLQYLRQFLLRTNWQADQGQEFWFDDFAILPED